MPNTRIRMHPDKNVDNKSTNNISRRNMLNEKLWIKRKCHQTSQMSYTYSTENKTLYQLKITDENSHTLFLISTVPWCIRTISLWALRKWMENWHESNELTHSLVDFCWSDHIWKMSWSGTQEGLGLVWISMVRRFAVESSAITYLLDVSSTYLTHLTNKAI